MADLGLKSNNKPVPPSVLVVAHSDGHIEIFGDQVDARSVNTPAMSSSAGEILAEDYISSVLPQRFRDIYFPGNLLAIGMVRTVTPLDLAQYFQFRDSWRKLDSITTLSRRVAS
ncbi:MAG: hypothetical protein SGI77_09875 [Pirellulaceae bacterium]|nr:hypothetical protein [Pirellulaceae bacterium]